MDDLERYLFLNKRETKHHNIINGKFWISIVHAERWFDDVCYLCYFMENLDISEISGQRSVLPDQILNEFRFLRFSQFDSRHT